jgi:CheY-like chemotaxis protein
MTGREDHFQRVHGPDTSVLIVEDEAVSRRALAMLLAHVGYNSTAVGSAEEALALVAKGRMPDIALIDLDLPGMSGGDLIDRLAELDSSVRPIVISAADQDRLAATTSPRHVMALRKPLNFEHLLSVLAETKTLH